MTYHYIYKTTLLLGSLANHYYYGKHTTSAIPENCGYAGSGVVIKDYFKKYGKVKGETYDIEIIELNPDKNTNAEREIFHISQHLGNPLCVNIARGGFGGGSPGRKMSEETKRKLSAALKGRKRFRPEGFTLSPEQRRKISEALKGRPSPMKGRPSPMKGRKHSPESLLKISLSQKGRIMSEETKEKMRNAENPNRFKKGDLPWNFGISPSEETRQKISSSLMGKTVPEEIVKKRADAQRGRKNTDEVIEKMRDAKKTEMKSVIATRLIDGANSVFNSIAEAARELNLNRTCIIGVLKQKDGRTQTGGYTFQYV